jgi:hypothetical protein
MILASGADNEPREIGWAKCAGSPGDGLGKQFVFRQTTGSTSGPSHDLRD